MTPLELHRRAAELGLRIEPAGDKLAVMPKGHCPPDFANVLREHKAELLAWLSRPPCPGWRAVPPDHLPLNPIAPRPQPADARHVVDFISRQTNGADTLCEWCLRREIAYWTAFHWTDTVCCYATARDAACWQLNRDERGVLELLSGFGECSRNHTTP